MLARIAKHRGLRPGPVMRSAPNNRLSLTAACGGCGFIPKPVLASQIALVALSYILHGRLGRAIPGLQPPSSLAESSPEPASSECAGAEQPLLASRAEVAK